MIGTKDLGNLRGKKMAAVVLTFGAMGMAGVSQAQTTTYGTFNVNITLTTKCNLGAIAPVTFAYTSLQTTDQNSGGGAFTIACTQTLPYSFGLQAGNGAPVGSGSPSITVNDDSGIGLSYTINAPASGVGNGGTQNLTLAGIMAKDQAGVCASPTGSCTNGAASNNVHTLIVTY